MAVNADIEIGLDWQEVTDADMAGFTFLNNGPGVIRVQQMATSTPPTTEAGDRYGAGQGERGLTPDTGLLRLHMKAEGGHAIVTVRTIDA